MADYGYDLSCTDDLTPTMLESGSPEIMPEVCYRRLITRRGSMLSALDEETIDVRDYLSTGFVPDSRALAEIRGGMISALQADARVLVASVTLNYTESTGTLTARITGDGSEGPFALTIAATSVTLELLDEES